jgi:hypothetical protein
MDEFENNGCEKFIDETITIQEAYRRGYTILTSTKEDRDRVFKKCTPNWLKELKVGDILLCKENQRTFHRESREWYNGLYYKVSFVDNSSIRIKLCNGNKEIYIVKTIVDEYFQPPYAMTGLKGQGKNFDKVVLYLSDTGINATYWQFYYLCASRAKQDFKIVLENKESKTRLKIMEGIVKNLGECYKTSYNLALKEQFGEWFSGFQYELKYANKRELLKLYNEHSNNKDYQISYNQLNYLTSSMKLNFWTKERNFTEWHNNNNLKYSDKLELLQLYNNDEANKDYQISYTRLKEITKDMELNYTYSDKASKYMITRLQQVLVSLKRKSTFKFKYLKEAAANIDYFNTKITKEADLEQFKRYFDVQSHRYNTYFALGSYFKRLGLDEVFSENDLYALITYRIALEGKSYSDYDFDRYFRTMENGLEIESDDTTTSKRKPIDDDHLFDENYEVSKITAAQVEARMAGDENYKSINKVVYNDLGNVEYKGKISGRYSYQYDSGATISTAEDWNTDRIDDILNVYNLYDTEYIVIDIDKTFEGADIEGFLARWGDEYSDNGIKKYGALYRATDNTSKHELSCHIWFKIKGKMAKKDFEWGEILGNAKSQAVKLKTNKYAADFRPHVDSNILNLPHISEDMLINTLKEHNMYIPKIKI